MSTSNPDRERRTVLRGALAAGGALCAPVLWAAERSFGVAQNSGAAPSGKMSKAQAKYQDQPKGDQNCANCLHFIAESGTCQVVDGKVSPNGWSILWAKKA
jgi:hypothetical protein